MPETPSNPENLLNPEQLQADIRQAAELYRRIHPLALATFPVQDPGKTLDDLAQQCCVPLSQLGFYRLLAPVLNGTGDEHTHLMFPHRALSAQAQAGGFLPLMIMIYEGKTFCAAALNGSASVPLGSEIFSINGRSMQDILPVCTGFFSGTSLAQRTYFLGNSFPEAYFLAYGPADSFEVRYLPVDGGSVQTAVLSGCKIQERQHTTEFPILNETPLRYVNENSFRRLGEKTLLLEFRAFENPNGQFARLIKEIFSIAKAEGRDELIIDLRRNIGGNSFVASLLLGYLAKEPYFLLETSELHASEELKAHFLKFMPAPARWLCLQHLHPWTRRLWRAAPGEAVEIIFKPYRPLPESERFRGKAVVLSGPGDYSSSAIFLGAVKHYALAQIIGQPSGGYPTHYGNCTQQTLTHSGLMLLVPASVNHGLGCGPVMPDITVQNTPADLAVGCDAVLDAAICWLEMQR